MSGLVWKAKSPLNNEVVLKGETRNYHVYGDHENDTTRVLIDPHIKGVIEKPRYIYCDEDYGTDRHHYIDAIILEEIGHAQFMTVIVDNTCDPNEVITWYASSKLKNKVTKGGIIYDSHSDQA